MTSIAREIAKRIGKMMEEEAKEFIEELEKEIAEAFRPKSSTASIDSKIF
jgi:polyhydroxyalkanoate synthesis regulator phasin